MIEALDLTKDYGDKRAVDGLTFGSTRDRHRLPGAERRASERSILAARDIAFEAFEPTEGVQVQTVQRISPNAIDALKNALTDAFWRKQDLLSYLRAEVDDERLLDGIDWLSQSVYKRESVRRFIDRLVARPELHRDLLLRLMVDVAAMEEFPQLAWLEEGPERIAKARESVARLRKYMTPYEQQLADEAAARQRIESARSESGRQQAVAKALERLRADYFELFVMESAQRRGFAFEPWLRGLFDIFDLDPRASFRIVGEQVDGGFTLDAWHFLLEARWRKEAATRDDLGSFKSKVDDKAENTLGLFISIEGFEPSALEKHSGRGSPLILADGGDLLAVLEQRIDLVDLLRRKYRHAAMTGEIFFAVDRILRGES